MSYQSANNVAYSLYQPLTDIPLIPIVSTRSPVANDKAPIGSIWVNSATNTSYILTSVVNNVANWEVMSSAGGGPVITLEGNSGGQVPSTAGNINVVGDGTTATVVGDPSTSTLTITSLVSAIETVTGNSGGAVSPSAGNINIVGDGTTATVVGDPGDNTLTISSIVSSALIFIQNQVASDVTSISFTSGISSTYDNYVIVYNAALIDTVATDVFILQINTGSGFITSGYLTASGAATSGFTISSAIADDTTKQAGTAWLYNFTAASNLPLTAFNGSSYDSSGPTIATTNDGASYATGGSVTQLKILTKSGNHFYGNFTLYALSK